MRDPLPSSGERSGRHDFVIETGGLRVFQRLVAAEHRTDFVAEPLPSGIGRLDALLGGGLDRSTATLIMGPAGSGKSALAVRFAAAAQATIRRAACDRIARSVPGDVGVADERPSVQPASVPGAGAKPSLRVVIVEDNQDIRELQEALLRMEGHWVASAADGPEGVAMITGERPDLALIDLGLPGYDGFEVARRVRESCGTGIRLVASLAMAASKTSSAPPPPDSTPT